MVYRYVIFDEAATPNMGYKSYQLNQRKMNHINPNQQKLSRFRALASLAARNRANGCLLNDNGRIARSMDVLDPLDMNRVPRSAMSNGEPRNEVLDYRRSRRY